MAREAGFVVLDLSNVYGETELLSLWVSAADGHPSVTGHQMIAEHLFRAIQDDPTIAQDLDRVTGKE
jgi:hypothetical protein